MASKSGVRSSSVPGHPDAGHRPSVAGDGGDDREVDGGLVGVEVEEELVDLVEDLVGAGIGAVDLVEHDHRGKVGGEGLGQDVAGLGQRALGGVDEQHDPVDHGESSLDLAAEVGVPRRVDEVDLRALPGDGGRLGEDRDAPLALLVVGVHDPVDERLVLAEHPARAEEGVDERRLAVIDVGDEGDVAEGDGGGFGGGHGESSLPALGPTRRSHGHSTRRRPPCAAPPRDVRAAQPPQGDASSVSRSYMHHDEWS